MVVVKCILIRVPVSLPTVAPSVLGCWQEMNLELSEKPIKASTVSAHGNLHKSALSSAISFLSQLIKH